MHISWRHKTHIIKGYKNHTAVGASFEQMTVACCGQSQSFVGRGLDACKKTHKHTHTHTHTRTHTCKHTRARTHKHTCTHTHARTYTHTHARTHTRTHTHTHAHTHARTHTRTHTRTLHHEGQAYTHTLAVRLFKYAQSERSLNGIRTGDEQGSVLQPTPSVHIMITVETCDQCGF